MNAEITIRRQAFGGGLQIGLNQHSGKGRRWIIYHIISANCLKNDRLLLFESMICDYHEEMSWNVFQELFDKILN